MLNLIGAGGHALVVADVARRAGRGAVRLCVDDEPELDQFPPGTTWTRLDALAADAEVILAFGDLEARRRIRGLRPHAPPALVDPSAVVGHGVTLGAGVVAMPTCVVNARASVGADAILNTGCIVEHECVVGENSHLSPGARLAGRVRIGTDVHVGTGAIVLPGVSIGDGATVGAGAVVLHDVPAKTTVVGVPARALQRT